MILAQKGYRVLLLERDGVPSNMTHSTHLIHPLGVAYLKDWGLLEAIEARSKPFTDWTVDLHGAVMHGPPPSFAGVAHSIAPRRDILDGELAAAAERAGAELQFNCRVGGLMFEDGRVVGVEARDKAGRKFSTRAQLVIGADGPGSMVAKCTAAEEYHAEPPLQSNIWSYWRNVDIDHLYITVHQGAGVFAFPSSDGSVLIASNLMYRDFLRARRCKEEAFYERLNKTASEIGIRVSEGERIDRFYSGCTRSFVRRSHGPGWALVGDAGMKKDPVTAQGIATAFATADMLASAVHRGFSLDNPDLELAKYERERNNWLMPYYHFTLRLAEFSKPNKTQMMLNHALVNDEQGRAQLFGSVSLTYSPDKFMAPDNVNRILARSEKGYQTHF